MIEATQKKLREAKFFLLKLNLASKEIFGREPEGFEFYLSAFLSAARSITFALQYEEKDKYDAWFPTWFSNRSEDDQNLLNFLKEQRNFVEKRGGAEVSVVWEFIPITEVKFDNRPPGYGFHWFGPPGKSPPRIGLPIHSFDLSGDQTNVTSACKQYMQILDDLIRDFIRAHASA